MTDSQAVEDVKQEQQTGQVNGVEFSETQPTLSSEGGSSLDILLGMDVQVSVSIGQAEIPVQKLLQLGPGSVLKLDKDIEAPVDLFLKGVKFATGSIVVVDGKFGIKIRDIKGLETQQPANNDVQKS